MEAPELTIDKNALFADKRAQFEKGISEGRSVKELTLELGIPKSTAYQWKNARTDDDDERRDPQPVAPPAVETTKRGRGRGKGKVSVRPITEETAGLLCAGLFMIPAMMQNEPDWLLSDVEKASLAGPFVAGLTGSANGEASAGIVLFAASPAATTVSGAEWSYSQVASTAASSRPLSGTYSVDAVSGRVSVAIGPGRSLVLYLGNSAAADHIAGFALALDNSAASGSLRAQSAITLADGAYALGTAAPAVNAPADESGALVLQNGVASGTLDQSSASGGLATSEFSGLTFAAQPDGSFTAPDGSGGTLVAVPAGAAFVLIDESGPASIATANQ